MPWWLIGALVWVALAVPAALLIGRAIREADARRVAVADAQLPAEAHAEFEPGGGNVVADQPPPFESPPAQWTGPDTVPCRPPPSTPRQRSAVVRKPLTRAERNPSHRDSGVR